MPAPLPWITDRKPLEEDADDAGDVIVLNVAGKEWYTLPWEDVSLGKRWLSFAPPLTLATTPAPTSRPRRFISITRTIHGATETIDAIADDGTAWWMVPGEVNWTQLPPLPRSEGRPGAGADRAVGVVP